MLRVCWMNQCIKKEEKEWKNEEVNECLADAPLCSSGLSFLPKHPHTPGLQPPLSEQTHLYLPMDTCPTLAKTE